MVDEAHIIDVEELVSSMKREQRCVSTRAGIHKTSEFLLIHKIQRQAGDGDKEVYEPSVLSVGPYHHESGATLEVEKMKWESLNFVLGLNPDKKMKDYIERMKSLEGRVRSCYACEIKMDRDNFLKMMLLDGCFILFLFCGIDGITSMAPEFQGSSINEKNIRLEQEICESIFRIQDGECLPTVATNTHHDNTEDSRYYTRQLYTGFFSHDLLLLENQIPFFVVAEIYKLATGGRSPTSLLAENIAKATEYLIDSYPKAIHNFDVQEEEFHHLLHLCHMYFRPNQVIVKSNQDHSYFLAWHQLLGWHRATEYYKAGVQIEKKDNCTGDQYSLLDIEYCDGVMKLPSLTIDANTYCLFRNLVAFELTCPQFGNYVTSYVVFLSQFIKKPDDVSFLVKKGIILHELNSDAEVCDLSRMLAEGATFDFKGDHDLKPLCHALELHYQAWRQRWRGWFGSINSRIHSWSQESTPSDYQFPGNLPEQYV